MTNRKKDYKKNMTRIICLVVAGVMVITVVIAAMLSTIG